MKKISRLQLQCFRFLQRLYGQFERLNYVRNFVELIAMVQLLIYVMGPIIPKFDYGEQQSTAENVISYGYRLTQKQSYSFELHILFQVLAVLFFLSFLTCVLYHGPFKKTRYLQSPLQFLISINALFLVVTPAYLILLPRHIFQLFKLSGQTPQKLISTILLPFQIAYSLCGILILRNATLITPIHLIIPILDMLNYNQKLIDSVVIVGCLLSLWINASSQLISTCNVLILTMTVWSLLEESFESNYIEEEIMGAILAGLFVVACLSKRSFAVSAVKKIENLKKIIDSCQKPESNRHQFYLQRTFIEHLPNCEGNFCSSMEKYENKTMLQLTRDQLREFLIQKIVVDSQGMKDSDLISKKECYKFEFNPKSQLKFYSSFYKSDDYSKFRGNWLDQIAQRYKRFKLLRHFRLILQRQNVHNLPLIQSFQRANIEQELFCRILSLLIKQEVLWRILAEDQQNNMLQHYIWDLHQRAREIHQEYNRLSQPPNESRRELYRAFCEVTQQDKPQNSLWTGRQLLSSEEQSNYIISDPEVISRVSGAFLRKFHYKESDLLNQQIDILLPIHLHKFHSSKIAEWDGMQRKEEVNKFILNGEGFIERVKYSWLVYPLFQQGLKYVSFISSYKNEYLLLYNGKEDHVIAVSEAMVKLMEEMGITKEVVEEQRSQDMFKNIDLKGVGLRTKGQMPVELLKMEGLKGTIHLVGQYCHASTQLLLMRLHLPQRQHTLLPKLTETADSFRDTQQKIRETEQIQEVKAQSNNRSRTSKLLLLANAVFFLCLLTCIMTVFINSAVQLDSFKKQFQQLEKTLDLHLCFARIMSLNSNIKLLETVIPVNMAQNTIDPLISWRKQALESQLTLLNQLILSRMDNRVQILEFTQIMSDKNSFMLLYNQIDKILNAHDLFNKKPGLFSITTFIYSFYSVVIIYVVFNIFMAIRVQRLMPHVRALLTELEPKKCLRQAKEIGLLILMNLKCQNISDKFRVNQEKLHRNKIKKDEYKDKFEQGESKFMSFLKNNFILLFVMLFSVMLLSAIGLLVQSESNYNQVIKEIQLQNYQRAINIVRIEWLFSLALIEKSSGQPKELHKLFFFHLNELNIKSDRQYIAQQLPSTQYGNVSNDLWHLVNKNICALPNITVKEGNKTCQQLGAGVLSYGQQKSTILLQNILRKIMGLQNPQKRYENGLMFEASQMMRLLALDSQSSAKLLCQNIGKKNSQKIQRLAVQIAGYVAALILITIVSILDERRKETRVDLLKQFFRLIPSAEFDLKKTVNLWWKEECLLELIKAI